MRTIILIESLVLVIIALNYILKCLEILDKLIESEDKE